MSVTEETADDEVDETAEPSTAQTTTDSGSDFVTAAEKDLLQEWVVYVTGVFAAVGFAVGLNTNIQDQWAHNLVSISQGGVTAGVGFQTFGGLGLLMTLGVIGTTVLGVTYAWNIDNENQTAYKVAAATAIVAIPVLSLVGGILATQPSDASLEFVNVIVSGVASGIAGAVGSAIVVYLTEEQAPDALSA